MKKLLEVVQGRMRKMPKLDLFGSSLMQPTFLGGVVLAHYDGYSHIQYFSLSFSVFFFLSASSIPFTAPPFLTRRDDSQFPPCLGYGFFQMGCRITLPCAFLVPCLVSMCNVLGAGGSTAII